MTDAPILACVFDAYGTLFDVHASARHRQAELGPKAGSVSQLWRAKQLEYSWLSTIMGRYRDFWQLTGDALDYALEYHGIDSPQLRAGLLDAYLHLDPYPEVRATLTELNRSGIACAILSNGSPMMLDAAVRSAGVSDLLSLVISVDELRRFKPDPSVYRLAADRLGIAPPSILFLSSNAWDAVGAASFGFEVAWVNRNGQPAERLPHQPHHQIPDLASVADLLRDRHG